MVSIGMDKVNIDVNRIPKVVLGTMCRAIAAGAEKFFEDPKNEAEFQEWLIGYKAKKNVEVNENE